VTPAAQPNLWPDGAGLKIGVVVSRFHEALTGRLVVGALDALSKCGVLPEAIEVFRVPGAFEIPGAVQQIGRLGRFDALVCLGVVIQGETPHFHYISSAVSHGVMQVGLELGLPVTFGVLTVATLAQADARSTSENNKGAEAAQAAVEMARQYQTLRQRRAADRK